MTFESRRATSTTCPKMVEATARPSTIHAPMIDQSGPHHRIAEKCRRPNNAWLTLKTRVSRHRYVAACAASLRAVYVFAKGTQSNAATVRMATMTQASLID